MLLSAAPSTQPSAQVAKVIVETTSEQPTLCPAAGARGEGLEEQARTSLSLEALSWLGQQSP